MVEPMTHACTKLVTFRWLVASALAATSLSGCTSGPNFAPPAPPSATAGYGSTGAGHARFAAIGTAAPPVAWWQAFGSPELNALVERALAQNESLAASTATLEAAQARMAAVAGTRLPQIHANARIQRQEANLAAFGFDPAAFGGGVMGNPLFNLYSVGGGISYDLDLFGGKARKREGVAAQTEAQAQQTAAARLTIAGRVVTQVLTIAAIRDRKATAEALVAEGERNVALTEARRKAGSGTLVEVLSAQSQHAAEKGELPALDQQLAEARTMLATLIGLSPAELGATDFSLARLILPTQVPVALPSALVRQRPDILAAEARLHAATASIGVATANLYPDITLGGSYAQSSSQIDSLLATRFRGFDLFAGLSAPIFQGGTLKAQKREAEAQTRAAAASYRQTVLEAFGQVANLLSAMGNDDRALAAAQDSARLAERSLDLSRKSFKVGNSGVLQVLEASRAQHRARLALVDAQGRQFVNVARLYVATAGGWSDRATKAD